MAGRKEKSTLDFIQLDCLDKTTFKRLNRKFGKEGRLFLIDLLRLLGRTEWYILDLSDDDILEDIMIDELQIEKELGISILNQLAKWNFICKETWLNHKNIWCQNLIDRHIEVFNKRRKIPVNPFTTVISVAKIHISDADIHISDTEMQQSKVKESKGNKTTKKETKKVDVVFDEFVEEIKKGHHQQWAEQTYMQLKLKKGSLTDLIKEFKSHLIRSDTNHDNVQSLKTHLNNWLNNQDTLKKLNQYKLNPVGGI